MKEYNELYQYARLCNIQNKDCETCPMGEKNNWHNISCQDFMLKFLSEAKAMLERWAKSRPERNIRQSKFLKLFPEARIDDSGSINICPHDVGADMTCPKYCSDCKRTYWLEEVDEDESESEV